jgi:Autotransporter beta-domain
MDNFKRALFGINKILIFVTMTFLSYSASAFDFTSNGVNYGFSTVTGYTANQALLNSQLWWGNATLASQFAAAVNNTAPNNTGFAYSYEVGNWYGGAGVRYSSNSYCCGVQGGGGINIISANLMTWAVVTRLGPSSADTQSSIHSLAPKLRSYYTSQSISTNFANMNTYDCDLFDAKGVCFSVGGQQTYVDNPSSNMTSTVVVAGYKVSPQIRIGGFLNQNINNNTVAGVHISNANPLMGLFAVWNQNESRLGYQLKIANAYQDKDVTTTRDVVGTSEAGTGSTTLNTQSYVGELSYAFLANEDKSLVLPYAAIRYTRIKQDGYTETSVSTPLTYASLADHSTTALVGVKLNHKLAEKVNLTGSLGIEQDLYRHFDNLTAAGVAYLTSENFNGNIKRTRPVASIGAYYMPVKNQRIAADLYYQQLPFQSTGSATAYVNYTIGF